MVDGDIRLHAKEEAVFACQQWHEVLCVALDMPSKYTCSLVPQMNMHFALVIFDRTVQEDIRGKVHCCAAWLVLLFVKDLQGVLGWPTLIVRLTCGMVTGFNSTLSTLSDYADDRIGPSGPCPATFVLQHVA